MSSTNLYRAGMSVAVVLALGLPISSVAEVPEKAPQVTKSEPWDVAKPPGFANATTAKIDVSEGTWLNVDVSPDGSTLVFDLLGDLYTLPVTGGEAKAVTSGLAWDMQPRFGPDGKWIAFTSDRAGGDNIWIIRADATGNQSAKESGLRQVTKESFRLLNSPAWTPDGNFIVAHKHFTSRRSLGAGRDLAVFDGGSRRGSQRRGADDHQAHGAERCRRAGILAGWPIPLLFMGCDTRTDLGVQQGQQPADLHHLAS